MTRTLAHLSDLHIGKHPAADAGAALAVRRLLAAGVDDVLVTGDVTHRGRDAELASFERIFEPLRDRLVVVPGNHDRMGDDVRERLMPGSRVEVERRPGLLVVRVDSTAPHNRSLLDSHGELSDDDVAAVDSAVGAAPSETLVVLMLHHHVLPLPADGMSERLSNLLGWPNAAELPRGRELLGRIHGRCDVVAHGHRHAPSALSLRPRDGRELRVMNAGSTPELGAVRVLTHARGRILAERWLDVAPEGRGRRSAGRDPTAPLVSAAA